MIEAFIINLYDYIILNTLEVRTLLFNIVTIYTG